MALGLFLSKLSLVALRDPLSLQCFSRWLPLLQGTGWKACGRHWLWRTGLIASWPANSSWTRDGTHVPVLVGRFLTVVSRDPRDPHFPVTNLAVFWSPSSFLLIKILLISFMFSHNHSSFSLGKAQECYNIIHL